MDSESPPNDYGAPSASSPSPMPPISCPPPTWQRFASAPALALFLFLLLPNPLPSAGAQPASTPPSDEPPLSTLAYGILTFLVISLIVFLLFLCAYGPCVLRCFLAPEGSTGRLAAPLGLDPAVIDTFPTVVYSVVKGHQISEASLECAVCLNDFEDDDMLRLIPKCDHAFHPDCIGRWLASHTTCPVCRTNLASQLASDKENQQAESGTNPPRVEVTPPDTGAPQRSQREGERDGIHPLDLWDKIESGSFNNRKGTCGSSRMRRLARSHSTGHSLIRSGEETRSFTLTLPAEVRKQLMDLPRPVLPQESCSRGGHRFGGEGSSRESYYTGPDRLDRVAMLERRVFNRMPSSVVRPLA